MRGRVMAIWTMMLSGLAAFGSLLVGAGPTLHRSQNLRRRKGMRDGTMAFGSCLQILQREARKLILKRRREDDGLVLKTKHQNT